MHTVSMSLLSLREHIGFASSPEPALRFTSRERYRGGVSLATKMRLALEAYFFVIKKKRKKLRIVVASFLLLTIFFLDIAHPV